MTPERHQQLEFLFHRALEIEPDLRSTFVHDACGADATLEQELRALLDSHDHANDFIARPAIEVAAKNLSEPASRTVAGRHLGQYEIISLLGAGGMGEVYLAQDTTLDRKVAIKFLLPESISDPQARKRLVREARAAAKLDHANICSIYEVVDEEDHCFIVMQYIEGENLANRIARKAIAVTEAIDAGTQLADALAEAHSHGIVHRDIKPHNIMITSRGQVKVLDFGLAKSSTIENVGLSQAQTSLTEEAALAGTVPYMSPEQLRGESVDSRSDVFSFGCVLYEMITGRQPFAANSKAETISAILTKEPPPLPGKIERVVRKALQKDKIARYASAKELAADLKSLQAPAAISTHSRRAFGIAVVVPVVFAALMFAYFFFTRPTETIDSLAVIPFVNVSGDADSEYLSDGLSDSIINSISQVSKLRVVSLSSVLRYKGQQIDPQQVGRQLSVRAVLMGRLIKRGDALTISTELVDIRDSRRLWGEQYNRPMADIIQLQTDISQEISRKLRLKLNGEDRQQLAKSYTSNSEAYQLYLQGRFYWNKYTDESFRKSIEYYNKAVEKDPNYALAYAGIADSYVQLGVDFEATNMAPKARQYALRAVQLDDTLPQAHMSLAEVYAFFDWKWAEAEKEYKRAIEINPNHPDVYHFYGHYLENVGQLDDAIRITKRGLELDPNSLVINAELSWAYRLARQFGMAEEQALKTLELEPHFGLAHEYLGLAYLHEAKYEQALAEFMKAQQDEGDLQSVSMELGCAYAASGRKTEARSIIRELQNKVNTAGKDPFAIAPVYAFLGDRDQAFVWLEKAYENHSFWLGFLKVDPLFDSLRPDPRFADLMRRVGLS